MYQSLLLSEF